MVDWRISVCQLHAEEEKGLTGDEGTLFSASRWLLTRQTSMQRLMASGHK